MERKTISFWDIVKVFARTGASAFGGWPTTALLLEKELVKKRKLLTQNQLKGNVAYAQILPGATQVSIVSSTGYKLRGFGGACMATASYLAPGIGLIVIFSIVYFQFLTDTSKLMEQLDGLIAALSGIILANAYRIGSKHTTKLWLWLIVGLAFVANLLLNISAFIIIIGFAVGGFLVSWTKARKTVQ